MSLIIAAGRGRGGEDEIKYKVKTGASSSGSLITMLCFFFLNFIVVRFSPIQCISFLLHHELFVAIFIRKLGRQFRKM